MSLPWRLAFGDSQSSAVTCLFQSMAISFADQRKTYVKSWESYRDILLPLESVSKDNGNLFFSSHSLLMAHEDKTYPGAFIASLSIPWGEVAGDKDLGGYHLVWVRDMVQTATAFLAAGNKERALRSLLYLAATQQDDGGFPQNFWIDGTPYWKGIQLDEVSFPIILAWRLHDAGITSTFDFYPMVVSAAAYLIRHGPPTEQERWEEASGYSPSTLAVNIAALICASQFARQKGNENDARYLEEYADFLESHLETWTVTTEGSLVPGISRHFIRIHPANVHDAHPDENANHGILTLHNFPPGVPSSFPARDIIDAGFLELVRYGIRSPHDPLIEDSLKVVDAYLKVETPVGPCWRRYNHDGYGQRQDGKPYQGWGIGRPWPLLTGERAHYELAAGRDITSLIHALEMFAAKTGMLPEQVWDEAGFAGCSDVPGTCYRFSQTVNVGAFRIR